MTRQNVVHSHTMEYDSATHASTDTGYNTDEPKNMLKEAKCKVGGLRWLERQL